MTLISDLDQAALLATGGAISIGNFDGVHRGHAVLLRQLRELADQVGGPAVVLTFDPHPATILRPDQAPIPLTWIERRAELLNAQGIDYVIACRPTAQLLAFSADDFFQQIIVDSLRARGMVEGPNFFFGKDRQGDVDRLRQLCHRAAIPLGIAQACEDERQMISSSWIRQLIAAGQIDQANGLLSAAYRICGVVRAGARRGRQLGVPTANLDEIPVMLPANGVYAGRVWCSDHTSPSDNASSDNASSDNASSDNASSDNASSDNASSDNASFKAAIHIGPNPTFGEAKQKVEVHLIDFSGDLYGQTLTVQIDRRIRGTQTFTSAEQLAQQLHRDILSARDEPVN